MSNHGSALICVLFVFHWTFYREKMGDQVLIKTARDELSPKVMSLLTPPFFVLPILTFIW
jgi:hypothetical protein